MIDQEQELRAVLAELEGAGYLSPEAEERGALDRLVARVRDAGEPLGTALWAESLAFHCWENPGDGHGRSRYGPEHQLAEVAEEAVEYWERRATDCPHPLMQFRYADLVWELSSTVRGGGAGVRTAHTLIDAAIAGAKGRLYQWSVEAVRHLDRAHSVALAVQDETRAAAVQATLVEYMIDVCEDAAPGAWGRAFDALARTEATPDLMAPAVADLEGRLVRAASRPVGERTGEAETAALRLARFYRRAGQTADVQRVLHQYVDVNLGAAESRGGLGGAVVLGRVYEVLGQFGARDEMERVEPVLRRLQEQSTHQMQTFSHEVEIPAAEIETFLDELTAGTLGAALFRTTVYFLPRRDEAIENERRLAEVAPLSSMFTTELLQRDGRVAARIGSIDDDPDGRLAHRISQDMGFMALFLREALDRLQKANGLTADALVGILCGSPLFAGQRNLLTRGLAAYFSGDDDVAVHVLIPQIEAAVRQLAESLEQPILRPRRDGGQNLRSLDDLLRDESVAAALGKDASFYLRVLLTDQRGWNLRNVVSHGLADGYDRRHADRAVHAMLLLGAPWLRQGAS